LLSDISIRDLVESKGFEASLITTFNASLPYYEELLLRRLRANGCRHNVVLMDSAQCAAVWGTESARPRQAGYDYSLIPIRSAGAFHPKVSIFAGPKKLALLVGSHNLTVAGLGFNREITNLIEIEGKKHGFGPLLAAAWRSISSWLEEARAYCPPELLEAGFKLDRYIKPFLTGEDQISSPLFLAQSEHAPSLFGQLRQQANFQVRRVLVTGAFFDRELSFLRSVLELCPSAEIVVGIDPETVVLPRLIQDARVRFVDVREAWPDEAQKYLHAKILYLESDSRDALFISGSANPSAPGWGVQPNRRNTEAMVLLRAVDAKAALERMGLDVLFGLQPMDAARLSNAVARATTAVGVVIPLGLGIIVGTADHFAGAITINIPAVTFITRVQVFDESDIELEVEATVTVAAVQMTITLPTHLGETRSLVLHNENGAFARVLVHHPSVVDAHSASTRQQAIRTALGGLGTSGTDAAQILEQINRAIFASDVANHVAGAKAAREGRAAAEMPARPETLVADAAEFGRRKKKLRLIESGDLGYLLEVLIRQLHIPNLSSPNHVPDSGPAGAEDDEEQNGPPPPEPPPKFDDEAIAAAVNRKSGSLIRKMIAKEKEAADDTVHAATMLVQLVAVLAILKELRHLERQGRWRDKGLELVDSHALESLMQKSMFYLFSSRHRLFALIEAEAGEHFEELDELNLLLTWLAWEVGYTFTFSIPESWKLDREDREFLLAGNGYLGKLLPRVGVDNQWQTLETAILRTIKPIPSWKQQADAWLTVNGLCSDALLDEFTNAVAGGQSFSVGGFAYVPHKVDPWSVVLDIDHKYVSLWDFDFEAGKLLRRQFLHGVAVPSAVIHN
jgi:hypothetical protein